jgi:hypothetical protein
MKALELVSTRLTCCLHSRDTDHPPLAVLNCKASPIDWLLPCLYGHTVPHIVD